MHNSIPNNSNINFYDTERVTYNLNLIGFKINTI